MGKQFAFWCCWFLVTLSIFIIGPVQANIKFKQLAQPPSVIESNATQAKSITLLGVNSNSVMVPASSSVALPVDKASALHATVVGNHLSTQITANPSVSTIMAMNNLSVTGKEVFVETPMVGEWQFTLQPNQMALLTHQANNAREDAQAYLLLTMQGSDYHLYSYFLEENFLIGETITFVAGMHQSDSVDVLPMPLSGVIETATLTVTAPNGDVQSIALQPNSIEQLSNGWLTADFKTTQQGIHEAQITVRGQTLEGDDFIRSTQHIFPVIEHDMMLNETASLDIVDYTQSGNMRLPIKIGIESAQKNPTHIQLSAELWGGDDANTAKAIAWFGGMVVPELDEKNQQWLHQTVDVRWLLRAGLPQYLELRNVEVMDPNYHVTLSKRDKVLLHQSSNQLAKLSYLTLTSMDLSIDEEMLYGPAPESNAISLVANLNDAKTDDINLLLVHGYCSQNVWSEDDFDNAYAPLFLYQNHTNDQFAQLLLKESKDFKQFGVVAHSQGGMAALHMLAFYWSGLDMVTSGRTIQTIGTPFHGTKLASNWAILGAIFGKGCGKNYDLTKAGAEKWLAKIPKNLRQKVYYSTSSMKDEAWSYDACDGRSDWILGNPDDGVISRESSALPDGHNVGHFEGLCHIDDMNGPAQTKDKDWNKQANQLAARW